MEELNPYIDIGRLVAAGIIGGLIGAFTTHKLTAFREQVSGKRNRKRDFLAYMKQWRHEIDRWHMAECGRQRHTGEFYEGVSGFCVVAEMVRNDFSGNQRTRFDELTTTITSNGKLEYGYKHDDLVKTIDEIIAIAEEN